MKNERNILFRGKDKSTGEWVFGYYVHFTDCARNREAHLIFTGFSDSLPKITGEGYDFSESGCEVDPETIGQFVCLDCKGNNLFDGDIVRTRVTDDRFKKNPRFEILVVKYNEKYGKWENGWIGKFYPSRMEVIGNIFDNPSLLENK